MKEMDGDNKEDEKRTRPERMKRDGGRRRKKKGRRKSGWIDGEPPGRKSSRTEQS